jgi:hypothetical protein
MSYIQSNACTGPLILYCDFIYIGSMAGKNWGDAKEFLGLMMRKAPSFMPITIRGAFEAAIHQLNKGPYRCSKSGKDAFSCAEMLAVIENLGDCGGGTPLVKRITVMFRANPKLENLFIITDAEETDVPSVDCLLEQKWIDGRTLKRVVEDLRRGGKTIELEGRTPFVAFLEIIHYLYPSLRCHIVGLNVKEPELFGFKWIAKEAEASIEKLVDETIGLVILPADTHHVSNWVDPDLNKLLESAGFPRNGIEALRKNGVTPRNIREGLTNISTGDMVQFNMFRSYVEKCGVTHEHWMKLRAAVSPPPSADNPVTASDMRSGTKQP